MLLNFISNKNCSGLGVEHTTAVELGPNMN